jgi:hypothetical protein
MVAEDMKFESRVLEQPSQAWRQHLRHGDSISGMETASQAWRQHLRHGDSISGMETASTPGNARQKVKG